MAAEQLGHRLADRLAQDVLPTDELEVRLVGELDDVPWPAEDGKEPPMKKVHVQRPHVDPSLCIGCGACEKVCPVQDKPAVYVTSVGETRSKTNVILLEDTDYNKPS